jgi:hypothetical protein
MRAVENSPRFRSLEVSNYIGAAERQVPDFLIGPRNKKNNEKNGRALKFPSQITNWYA